MVNFLKKRWYITIGIILVIVVVSYQQITSQVQGEKETAYTVKRQNLKEMLSLSGKIDAEEQVTLRFQTSGMLSWVGIKTGDYVKKYQPIASLDQRELEKNLKKYLSAYMKERWTFDQTKDDYKDVALTDAMKRIIDEAQFDLDSAVIDVELKDIALKFANLYTPIEGLVVRAESPLAGVNITPTQAEFEIINPKTIYFSATADQTDVVRLKQDLSGEVTLDSYPDEKLPAKIYLISFIPKEGETGTVYEVRLVFNTGNDGIKYRFGMTGDADFVLKEHNNVLAVPTDFIKSEKAMPTGRQGKKYVLKKVNRDKVKTFIQTGEEIDTDTEITAGLKEGDIIYD